MPVKSCVDRLILSVALGLWVGMAPAAEAMPAPAGNVQESRLVPPPGSGNAFRTRADLAQVVQELIAPVLRRQVPGGFHLGESQAVYGEQTARLEAFSRILWSLAPLEAGSPGAFPAWATLRGILADGAGASGAASPAAWGPILLCPKDQRAVEMAAISTAILLAPQVIWEPLAPEQRQAVVAWLRTIRDIQKMDNNWTFFRILTYTALRSVGEAVDEVQLAQDFATIDGCYLGDGWYSDGLTSQRDYYIPMAMHFYGLLYARIAERQDPIHAKLYRERAARFAGDFSHWFTPEGDALPFGRSLTYRFAQGAFWSAVAYAGVDVPGLSTGQVKGLLLRHLRWWFRQPIFTGDGLLTIGYRYPDLLMAESYNAAGSPYWAGKTFLILALPEDHPFWRTPEEPLPPRPAISVQRHPGMVLVHDDARAHTWALASGQDAAAWLAGQAPKYGKFAYSTFFGFCALGNDPSLVRGGFDSTLVVSDDDRQWRMRETCTAAGTTADGMAWFTWQPWPDVTITSWLRPAGPGHLRLHRIRTGRTLQVADSGFALPVRNNLQEATLEGPLALITNAAGTSALAALTPGGTAVMGEPLPNLNLLHPLVRVPMVRWSLAPGDHWLASAVVGLPGAGTAAAVSAFLGRAKARLTSTGWLAEDGAGTTLVALPAEQP